MNLISQCKTGRCLGTFLGILETCKIQPTVRYKFGRVTMRVKQKSEYVCLSISSMKDCFSSFILRQLVSIRKHVVSIAAYNRSWETNRKKKRRNRTDFNLTVNGWEIANFIYNARIWKEARSRYHSITIINLGLLFTLFTFLCRIQARWLIPNMF